MKEISHESIEIAMRYVESHSDLYAFAYNGVNYMHVIVYPKESVIAALRGHRVWALEESRGAVRISGKSLMAFRKTFGAPLFDIETNVDELDLIKPVEGYRGASAKAAAFETIALKAIATQFTIATVKHVGNLHNSKIDGIVEGPNGFRMTVECKYFHGTFA